MNEVQDGRSILRTDVGRFVWWACFLGIFVPVCLAGLCDLSFSHRSNTDSAFGGFVYFLFLLTVGVAFGGPFLVCYSQLTNSGTTTGTARNTLYAVGFLTALLMGLIVALTGGPLKSPFVFYLLYLPAITAVCFTTSKKTRLEGQGVLIVAVVCAIMHFLGMNWSDEAASLDAFCASREYTAWYLFMVSIQLFSIVYIEHKSRKKADGAKVEK